MYKKILVPLDGSQLSENSLEHLKSLVKGSNQPEVVLLRVVEPISSFDASALASSGFLIGDILHNKTEDAKNYVSGIANKLEGEGMYARGDVVNGQPAEAILDYAEKNNIDLIVMSSHGRTGISRWAFGSVADKVLHHSKVPVLLVSAPGRGSKA